MKTHLRALLLVALCIAVFGALTAWMYLQQRDLEMRLKQSRQDIEVLTQIKRKSQVDQSVSRQMGEIADAERNNALHQAELAEERALEAQKAMNEAQRQTEYANKQRAIAEEQTQEAETQRRHADKQRVEADLQRQKAEDAKEEANTLRMRSLGVSLANMALTQHQVGNHTLARGLAYAAWQFIVHNDGDPNAPLEALIVAAGGIDTLHTLKGGISSIALQKGKVYCVSKYGEACVCSGKQMNEVKMLCQDAQYDFRQVHVTSDGTVCAKDKQKGWLNLSLAPFKPLTQAPITSSQTSDATTYGNGNIAVKVDGGQTLTLQGMRSQVTGTARIDNALFACGMDGTLRVWNLRSDLLMPVTLFHSNKWIYCMQLDRERSVLYLGTAGGLLLSVCVSPQTLAANITERLNQDQWREFVGADIPYNTYR